MTYHFFSKLDPRTAVGLSNGLSIKFRDIGIVDGEHLGLWSTTDQTAVSDIRTLIQAGKGGMRELDYAEYMELKKNLTQPKTQFREEIKNTDFARRQTVPVADAVPVEDEPVAPMPPINVQKPVPRQKPTAKPVKKTPSAPPPPRKK